MAQKIKYMTKIHSEVVEPGEPKDCFAAIFCLLIIRKILIICA